VGFGRWVRRFRRLIHDPVRVTGDVLITVTSTRY